MVFAKTTSGSPEEHFELLVDCGASLSSTPPVAIEPPGLRHDRQKYLQDHIRPARLCSVLAPLTGRILLWQGHHLPPPGRVYQLPPSAEEESVAEVAVLVNHRLPQPYHQGRVFVAGDEGVR